MSHEAADNAGLAAQDAKKHHAPYTTLPSATPDRASIARVLRDVMIPMRDGVRLATDVYVPTGAGPFPSILTRLPYGKTEDYCYMPVIADYWVRKGYAAVVQDVRGKWGSEGVFEPNSAANEINDGHDTIDWIASQPWSNGRLGMWGESYFGFTSWAGAVSGHPALVAIAPGDITVDRYRATFRHGCLQLNTVGLWAISMMAREYQDLSELDTWHLPLAEMGDVAGVPSSYFDSVIANPRPSAFWDERSLLAAYDTVRIPVLHWTGWYDLYLGHTIADWQQYRREDPNRDHHHLFVGPWDHEGTADLLHHAGLTEVPDGTLVHRWDTFAAFFDRYLAGLDNGFGDRGPVHYYTLGADTWRDAADWPPPAAIARRLYLRSDAALSAEPPAAGRPDEYEYNPRDPVAWTAGIDCWGLAGGMGDRRPIEARTDVLTYTTAALEAALDVTGSIRARLWVSSSAAHTDFTAALCDVFPDGSVNLIQDGIVRTTHRDSEGASPPLVAGEVYAIEIDLWSASYAVAAGHRLRLEVSSSEFNRYDRNPNTDAPFGREAEPVIAHQAIFHDAERPSHLELSVIPAGG